MWLNGEVACPELEPYHSDTVREIIYTAAFLHDIGRFMEYADKSLDHALESEKLSRPFLQEAGFSRAEAELIPVSYTHLGQRRPHGNGIGFGRNGIVVN